MRDKGRGLRGHVPDEECARQTRALGTYTAYGWWMLAGGGAGRALDPTALTPAQRLTYLAAHHHSDITTREARPYHGCSPTDLAALTATPAHLVKVALHRLVRLHWLTRDPRSGLFQVSTVAHTFARTGWLDDPASGGTPLIDVLADDATDQHT